MASIQHPPYFRRCTTSGGIRPAEAVSSFLVFMILFRFRSRMLPGVRQSYSQIKNSQGPFAEFLDGRGIAQDFPPPRPMHPLPPIPLVSNARLNHPLESPACLKHTFKSHAQSRSMPVTYHPGCTSDVLRDDQIVHKLCGKKNLDTFRGS